MPTVSVAVEGILDETVVRRVLDELGVEVATVYVTRGTGKLDQQLSGFNKAARHSSWLVLRDLDDAECAPGLKAQLLARPSPGMLFRIAEREVESWLLADRAGLAKWLSVSLGTVPRDPDRLAEPKAELLRLALKSRLRAVRVGVVRPLPGGRLAPGPEYNGMLGQFVLEMWQMDVAAQASPSLARCLRAVRALA